MKRIAFTGVAGSGKSTAASYLSEYHGFRVLSFASPIKRAIRSLLIEGGASFLDAMEMTGGSLKEKPTVILGGKTPRQAMQMLGHEFGRGLISPSIWREILIRKVTHDCISAIAVDDLRYSDEAEDLRSEGFIIVRVVRDDSGTVATHPSEDGDFHADITILNDGTVKDLRRKMDEVLAAF